MIRTHAIYTLDIVLGVFVTLLLNQLSIFLMQNSIGFELWGVKNYQNRSNNNAATKKISAARKDRGGLFYVKKTLWFLLTFNLYCWEDVMPTGPSGISNTRNT